MSKTGRQPGRAVPKPRTGSGLMACLIGIAATAVVTIGAVAVWEQVSGARERAEAATAQAETAAVALGALAVEAVADGELAALQQSASSLLRRLGAQAGTIELADGQVLFDLSGQRPAAAEIPETWASLPTPAGAALRSGQAVQRASAPGRGEIVVSVTLPVREPTPLAIALAAPAGLAGLCLAISLWLVVRAFRLARPLRHICDALGAAAAGERCAAALGVHEGWGPSAQAWNELLADRERVRGEVLAELSSQTSTSGGGDSLAQRACDTLPAGLLLLDGVGGIRYGNGAAAMLLGVARDDLVGQPLPDLIGDASLCEQINSVLSGGSKRRATCEGERRVGDNRSILRFTALRMGHEEGDAVMVVVEDVTQQRTADAARDAFVAQATHELRTPLTNIRLYLELLLEGEAEGAEQERSLNVISQEARRLERMVGDMLSVADIEAGSLRMRFDDVRMDQLLAELEADYQAHAAEAEVTLTFDLPPKLPVIRGDRDKIALCLHNLIANAVKYTPAGGDVVVSAEEREEVFVVRVSDTGMGVAAEERERIFQRFYRAQDERIAKIPGTGLGLALARDVARLHGGDISVESEVNRGSTFAVTFPMQVTAKN